MARKHDKLTALGVKNLTKPGLYHDGRGLYLRIGPTGAKSWVFRYTGNDGKRHDLGLGSTFDVSLAEARDDAAAHGRALRREGVDPLAAKRTAAAERRAAEVRNITFRQCALQYLDAQQSRWKSNEGDIWRARLRDYVFPVLGDMPVAMVDLALVLKVLKPHWETMASMAKIRGYIESILAYAAVHGFRSTDNPARWTNNLSVVLPSRSKTAQQDHFAALPHSEIAAYMANVRKVDKIGARALEFTVLTAARRGETLGAKWSEIDFQARLWTVPASRMKMGKEHVVPLSDAALALLSGLPRQGASIFPMGPDAMHNVAKRLHDGVTVHGFRSCFRDWAGDETNFERVDVELCLAHQAGDSTEQSYRRMTAVDKRRVIMQSWADYCGGNTFPTSGNVRTLHAVAG